MPLVPHLLDRDERYEYLTFLPGFPCFRPWPEEIRGNSAGWLRDLGLWLRSYHNAVRGFRVNASAFLWGPTEPTADMLVCHGDLGPWNLLHRNGRLTGVIDWDLARYGDPLDDVAELALEAIPLTGRHEQTLGENVTRGLLEARLDTFCDAYGVATETVIQHLPDYLRMAIGNAHTLAEAGREPFVTLKHDGYSTWLEADLKTILKTWY